MKVVKEIEIGELFKILNIDKQGNYIAPSSLKVLTPYGFKKVNTLIKTQENPEWKIETENGTKGIFADFHKVETENGKIKDLNKNWTFIKDLKNGDRINTKNGLEKIKNVFFNGKYSEMYDLQVDEVCQYYTNGIVSHNTGFMGNIAINAFMQGKKVLVYTFETSTERLLMRYYANLAEMSKKEMALDEVGVKQKINNKTSMVEGDLILKEYNANAVCSNELMAHITDLELYQGFKPDLVVVDYILIMRANDRGLTSENSYKYYKTISEELRNIAKTLSVPVITACQINREGMSDTGRSKAVITAKDIAESRGIYDTVDVFMTMAQTANDYKKNRLFLCFDKNRNGRTGTKIDYTVNYDHMKISENAIVEV